MSQQINLFNPIFLKKKKYFSAATMAQALALILAGSGVLSAYASYRLSSLEKEAQATAAQLAALKAKSDKVSAQYAPKKKSKSLEDEVRNAESELSALQFALSALHNGDLGNTGGFAEYMRAFSRQIVNGVWLTGFSIDGAGVDITIQGSALNPELVPVYIGRLKGEAVLQGKSFAALDMRMMRVAQQDKVEQPVAGQKMVPSYIDFILQSSGAKSK